MSTTYDMLFVLLIHATVLLIITAQKNLTPSGQASQISTLQHANAIKAIQPPISNRFSNGNTIYCTHTAGYNDPNPQPAWWMIEFSFESAYITEIQIYYRDSLAIRMDGFELYVTNTSTIPPDGYLCYKDPDPGLPNITQNIPCNQLGKYVIYYDRIGSDEGKNKYGPIVELCYVAINGCPKSFWGSNCENLCAENCIERNCFPGNGSCVWGCHPTNCLNDVCDKDTAICIIGCKERRTGTYCNKYNMASYRMVSQNPSGSQPASLANDGNKTSCSKTIGKNVTFQVDLMKESIVTGMYIIFNESKTLDGHHTVYASNKSYIGNFGKVVFNGTTLPTEINLFAVFRYLTYVPPSNGASSELELCEIGIIGCPPTHYGPFCNKSCPENCRGPCDLDSGHCKYGCINGWTGYTCDEECHLGFYGNACLEPCSANCSNPKCNHVTGECIGGCKDEWQGFNCSQSCPDRKFGNTFSQFCDG